MNWLRDNYRQMGKDGLALLIMIIFLALLYMVGVGFEMQQ